MGDSVVEEVWSAPRAGTVMGMFRWSTDTDLRLYEFMAMVDTDDGLKLYLRHFGRDLVAWEDKASPMTFELSSSDEQKVVFESHAESETTILTYERQGDALSITLDKVEGEKQSQTVFNYRLQD